MSTAEMVHDRLLPLEVDAAMEEAINFHLKKIGMGAIGVRGNSLVIRVKNLQALPEGSFRAALRETLDAIPGLWKKFDRVTFN